MKLRHFVYGKFTHKQSDSTSEHTILYSNPSRDSERFLQLHKSHIERIYTQLNCINPTNTVRAIVPLTNLDLWAFLRILGDSPKDSYGRPINAYHALILNKADLIKLNWRPLVLDSQLPQKLGSECLFGISGERIDTLPDSLPLSKKPKGDTRTELLSQKATHLLDGKIPSIVRLKPEALDPVPDIWANQSLQVKTRWGFVSEMELPTDTFPGKDLEHIHIGLASTRRVNIRISNPWVDLSSINLTENSDTSTSTSNSPFEQVPLPKRSNTTAPKRPKRIEIRSPVTSRSGANRKISVRSESSSYRDKNNNKGKLKVSYIPPTGFLLLSGFATALFGFSLYLHWNSNQAADRLGAQIGDLSETLLNRESTIDDFENRLVSLTADIQVLARQIASNNQPVSDIQSRISEIELQSRQYLDNSRDIHLQISEIRKNISTIKADIDEHNSFTRNDWKYFWRN